jgi:hypothetical protein
MASSPPPTSTCRTELACDHPRLISATINRLFPAKHVALQRTFADRRNEAKTSESFGKAVDFATAYKIRKEPSKGNKAHHGRAVAHVFDG